MNETVTLREYIESRFAAVDAHFHSLQVAVDKAEQASSARFESVNEMRGMVTDATRQYISRGEADAQHKAIHDKIEKLEASLLLNLTRVEYDNAHRSLVEKIDAVQKMLYVGLGVLAALQFLISIVVVIGGKHIFSSDK